MKLAKLNGLPEIFHSIQGEGKSIGKPSVFIRLSLCNLYCIWCDTDYTWNWNTTKHPHNNDKNPKYRKFNKRDFIITITPHEIIERLKKIDCCNIIITGGEPMVQHKELLIFLKLLKSYNEKYNIEIETNGTIKPNKELDLLINQYNVSVKSSNSRVKAKHRLVAHTITFFANSRKANFKFVIDNKNDLDEILSIQKEFNIHPSKIFLMPQGVNPSTLKEKQEWLIEICKRYQFNYTDRLHILIYGNKRGV